ncbi:V/A-type H+-transporting ATPase subunit I [Acetoanaerobium pronyense]|uniref:V/A-type H+-transporting ATPase subunit I n=1 Tax=Acetoanaerobium pronyense TaxID=1482736 RepID=A0ABS4KJ01_9FIRM|nr:V-type ATPase 116kDa subunit family protein [Acetoanaerobium pronyense]MBP2027760.1 V/A-type H+-transporting ATPase subunit I [Acetoanaerobium pronyense]
MAVEKMEMMNLVAPIENIHEILEGVVLTEKVHIQKGQNSGDSNFTLSVLEDALSTLRDMGSLVRYKASKKSLAAQRKDLQEITDTFDIIPDKSKSGYGECSLERAVDILCEMKSKVDPIKEALDETFEEIRRHRDFLESIKYLLGMDIDVSEFSKMKHFNYHIGTLTKERRIKLRNNYENISAVVLHIGSSEDGEAYLIFAPSDLDNESVKILKSLNFKEIKLPVEFKGTPDEVYKEVVEKIKTFNKIKEELEEKLSLLKEDYKHHIDNINRRLDIEEQIESLKDNLAVSRNFFYFSGWIPKSDRKKIKAQIEKLCPMAILSFEESEDIRKEIIPPTKLKNSWLLRPFEMLVNLYGVPNYKEIDPTFFLGLTYLILFGAMFGDVGQGSVIMLGGWLLKEKSTMKVQGELMMRVGISSVIFGFLYGSLFGFETVLPALLIRPIENIDTVLLSSVIFGVILLLMSFGLSIKNAVARRDIEEGLFGRNGLAGLLFYIVLLITVVQLALSRIVIPIYILFLIGAFMLSMILFRNPIASAVLKKTPSYHGGKKEYYIEGSFDLIETLLSLLSNTISFIRIGAFALNHVGLFLAFETMAHLSGNPAASVFIIILGNVIIIALEGLIVFIQGLRLEYYEMFSKYYKGDGVKYEPLKITKT